MLAGHCICTPVLPSVLLAAQERPKSWKIANHILIECLHVLLKTSLLQPDRTWYHNFNFISSVLAFRIFVYHCQS